MLPLRMKGFFGKYETSVFPVKGQPFTLTHQIIRIEIKIIGGSHVWILKKKEEGNTEASRENE